MPVSSSGVITAARPLNTLDGQVSGVVRQSDFAVCGDVNPGTQVKISTANVSAGTTVTISAPAASGTLAVAGLETVQYATPTTGTTVTVDPATTALLVNPAGTLLALTIAFPPGTDGKYLIISCSQILTGLTLTASGSDTILGAVTALASANLFATYIFSATAGKWFRAG